MQYYQYMNESSQFESTEGGNETHSAQTQLNEVAEVINYIRLVYCEISNLRVTFNMVSPWSFQSRPYLMQYTILHTAHSVTTTTAAVPPPPPPPTSTQQPTSTQTTNTSQSIPSVRAYSLDFLDFEE